MTAMEIMRSDYVVIGAGAMGLALTDVLLDETDATITMVERRDRPGGHWNDAYPFVRLHQPSAFYGVNSVEMSAGRIDERGGNAGLAELATGTEVCAYFDRLVEGKFLGSGRVTYLPRHDYADGHATSLLTGATVDIEAGTRIIDCTYMKVRVPSMGAPTYDVDDAVTCIPPNGLPGLSGSDRRFVVIGAGKTALDACLWLLDHGLDPERITWVRPRDAWMLNRAKLQPGSSGGWGLVEQLELAAAAATVDELFDGLEQSGQLLRLDREVRPTMYRCATVTERELDALRAITDVVRLGHVRRLAPGEVILDEGTVATESSAVFVDCTADGLARLPAVDVFTDGRITAQPVRYCQQVFSAAFIGHVEAAYDDDAVKNEMCRPIPHPDDDLDWLRIIRATLVNQITWLQDPGLIEWLGASRLDAFSSDEAPTAADAELSNRIAVAAFGAVNNLQRLLDE